MADIRRTQQEILEETRQQEAAARAAHLAEIKERDPVFYRAIAEIEAVREASATRLREEQERRFAGRVADASRQRQQPGHTLTFDGRSLGVTQGWHQQQLETQLRASDAAYLSTVLAPYEAKIDRLREEYTQREARRGLSAEAAPSQDLSTEVAQGHGVSAAPSPARQAEPVPWPRARHPDVRPLRDATLQASPLGPEPEPTRDATAALAASPHEAAPESARPQARLTAEQWAAQFRTVGRATLSRPEGRERERERD